MPGVRLKKSLNTKPKLSAGHAKETASRVSSSDRRRHESRDNPRGHRRGYESDGIGSDSEPYRIKRSSGRKADLGAKGKTHRFVRERNGREVDTKGSFRSDVVHPKWRRPDDNRDVREDEKSLRVRAPNRKSSTMEEQHIHKEHKDFSVARKGKYSDVGLSRRKPSYVKQRNFEEDDVDTKPIRDGEAREMRGHRGKKDDNYGGRVRRSSVMEERDVGLSRRKPSYAKQRNFDKDDLDIEPMSGEARSMRGHHRNTDDNHGGRDRRSSAMEERQTQKVVSVARVGKYSDVGLSRRKPSYAKQRNLEEDDSDIETSDGDARALRGHRGKKDDNHGGKDFHRSERRGASVEASADHLRLKGKKRDGITSTDKCRGDAQVKLHERYDNNKNKSDQIAAGKLDRLQTRLLDISGKRRASRKKSSDDEPAATDAPPKKRKRIKLDPYDISNKRLDDVVPDSGHTENTVEKEIKISMNAQFRSIQPSPSILSFVEDNLLGRRRLIELQNAGYDIKLSAPLDNIPFSTSTERERIVENVFRNKLEFFAAAKISSSFPPPIIPEIAFAGRSNVGKSSLLNALTRQWGVVRTSDRPGYTQTINFFRLASKLCLVDLPGYGFAYAKEEVKDAWEELVKEYVSTRVGLQRVCLLVDTKWGMKPRDHELIDLMERSLTPYQIVLTKTDAVFPIDVARRAMQIEENLKKNKSIVNPVVMVSSKSGAGIRSLRTVLAKVARFVKP